MNNSQIRLMKKDKINIFKIYLLSLDDYIWIGNNKNFNIKKLIDIKK